MKSYYRLRYCHFHGIEKERANGWWFFLLFFFLKGTCITATHNSLTKPSHMVRFQSMDRDREKNLIRKTNKNHMIKPDYGGGRCFHRKRNIWKLEFILPSISTQLLD